MPSPRMFLATAALTGTVLVADAVADAITDEFLPDRAQQLLLGVLIVCATVGFLARRVQALFDLGRRAERSTWT